MSIATWNIIFLSVKVATAATLLSLFPAIIVGYILAKMDFRGKVFVEGFIHLPLVMPPVTTGYLLLLFLGRNGLIGAPLHALGLHIAFTTFAAMLAAAVVSFPLMVRSIRLGIEFVDPGLEEVARTLGAGPFRTFSMITFPLAFPGILSGTVIGFARSLGEFGATITFAGNIEGVSQTIPLAVYALLQVPGQEKTAALFVFISVIISFIAIAVSSRMNHYLKR